MLKKYDVDDVYGYDSVKEGGWLWCFDCERAYKKGTYRDFMLCWPDLRLPYFDGRKYKNRMEFGDLLLPKKLCPYPDCGGNAEHGYAWKFVKECHKKYPETPEVGKRYHL